MDKEVLKQLLMNISNNPSEIGEQASPDLITEDEVVNNIPERKARYQDLINILRKGNEERLSK